MQQKGKPRKSRGQSLVEIAIAFPLLIMLFAGVVEFGFIINIYLSLLDATRESARFWSQSDPFTRDPVTKAITGNDMAFYNGAAAMVRANLDPIFTNPDYVGRRISLDPAIDDVIVTVYSVDVVNDTVIAYPGDPPDGAAHIYGNANYNSIFSVDTIRNTLLVDAPNAGILVVEVHYNYHQVLALPWITAVLSDPVHLRAYTMFPLNAAEPVVP
ncbi:MAG: pilus assembly protein [Chloroflexi bacterium]|nr:pilus assembly protein [Chloroflexota bacterium]